MTKFSLSASLAILPALSSTAWALDCPAITIDDPAMAAGLAQVLPADIDLDAPEALQSAVFELRRRGCPMT
jgi:hypothetical protein